MTIDGGDVVTVPSLAVPSPWIIDGQLIVGGTGTGTLNVQDGATVRAGDAFIGNEAGSIGTVTVAGAASLFEVPDGALAVGNLGTGTLTVEGGATAKSDTAVIGVAGASVGTVTVTGAGSSWQIGDSNFFLIGFDDTAKGTLNIEAGGKVTSSYAILGAGAGTAGTVTVTGAGSSWEVDQSLIAVGLDGTGTLTVADGATVTAAAIGLGSGASGSGTLNLSGTDGARGVLAVQGVGAGTGTAQINFNGGVLRATADNADLFLGFTASEIDIKSGGAFIDSNGYSVGITQALQGAGGLTKQGEGTLTLSAAATYTGATVIEAGTLALTGAGAIAASSALTADGTFDISAKAAGVSLNSLSGAATGAIKLGANTLTVTQNADGDFAGVISGTGGLYKIGSEKLTLSGINSYSGATTISNGTLALVGDGSITSSSNVTVFATLDISGTTSGATIHTLSGSIFGSVVLGGKDLTVVQDSYGNLGGIISGTGGLIKQGDGWLSLQGVNTYTGDTAIDAGKLSLMADGSIAASRSVTVDGAFDIAATTSGTTIHTLSGASTGSIFLWVKTLTVAQDADGTFAGVISDTGDLGRLVKEGSATLTLTGASTFGGGTTISGGTLQIGSGGTTGAILGDIENNAALVFNRANAASFGGVISGTGTLGKKGAGTLSLTGVNTFTGATSIAAGTLALSGAGAIAASSAVTVDGTLDISATDAGASIKTLSGAAAGAVALGAKTLAVQQNADGTFAGTISGDGGLTKQGTGTLVLTGASTFGGLTTISAGTLQIGDGGTTGALAGAIQNDAALVFDRSNTYAVASTLSGAGTTAFRGGGTALLSSTGSYSGTVTVEDASVLLQNAALASAGFVVADGGLVAGGGNIGALTVGSGGIVAPGFSPGTLVVSGPVTFQDGATYRVDVTPDGQHDIISASGAVTLASGARVEVEAVPGAFKPGTAYAIITTTDQVSGQFGGLDGGVSANYAFLDPGLSYDAQNVYLTLTYNGTAFTTFAPTANTFATARAAQALGPGNPVHDGLLQLPAGPDVANAFAALSGEAYASANTVIQQQSVYVRDAVLARLAQSVTGPAPTPLSYAKAPVEARLAPDLAPTLWMQGYGGWGNTFANGNAAAVSNTVGGFLMGADVAVSDHARAGVFGGYGRSTFDVDDRASSGTIDNYGLGLYAGTRFGALAARGALAYSWHDVSVDRVVAFPGFAQALDGGATTGSLQAFGELAWRLTLGATDVEPFAGLAYLGLSGARLRESGGSAALRADIAAMDTLYTTLGVRAATSWEVAGRMLVPSVTVGWQHAFGDTTPTAAMLFTGGALPFQVAGAPIAEDTLMLGAGLGYALSTAATLSVDYSGQVAAGAAQNAVTGRFAMRF
ncbi:autotransporter domain-containing protein [Xanthobacter pseudotagetidis]|uniref:autotransporter domain-containing protein n=1 Tax=Xanthobacter pseudotagetidis TaxID=3119911 RepID=UPI00372AFB68